MMISQPILKLNHQSCTIMFTSPIARHLFSSIKIPMEAVKRLREQTSAPMGDCLKALEQSNIDHEKALLWLKNKGLMTADRRAHKETREGVVGAYLTSCRRKAVLLEVNCQTDFVAKSQLFLRFVDSLGNRFLIHPQPINIQCATHQQSTHTFQQLLYTCTPAHIFPQDTSIHNMGQQLQLLISRLQQNIRIRRAITLHSDGCRYGSYVHRRYQHGIGLQACVVELRTDPYIQDGQEDKEEVINQFADDIATQILGSPPKYLTFEEIPSQVINQQTQKVTNSIISTLQKSPQHMHQKIISGKLHASFYSKYLLGCMPYLLSNEGSQVSEYWINVQNQTQSSIAVLRAVVWECK